MVKKYRYLIVFILIGALAILAIGQIGASSPDKASKREKIELTVYNQDLALIKDQREMELQAGIGATSFTDVASLIDPASVRFTALTASTIRVLEQNYEYDVINDFKLLQKYLGEKVKITDLKGTVSEGYLLNAGENLIISTEANGGEVKIIKAAQVQNVTFPQLPGGLVIKPTLVWLLNNPGKAGKQQVEVTYLTKGLSWKTDYIATINRLDNSIDLTGWVTLDNQSGAAYRNARLKLVAGDVNLAPEEEQPIVKEFLYRTEKLAQASDDGFKEEGFFEYHLYTLNRATTIKNNQIKQVELLTANSVPAKKLFIYEATVDPKKVQVMLEIKNSKTNNLGMPLPKGKIRVQKADSDGSLQFIGEDRIDHTPQDEKLRVKLGNAFDIVGERVRTNLKEPSANTREETYQITLRNHKKEAVTVTVVENMSRWRQWQIIRNDLKYSKTESNKAEFIVNLPPDGAQVFSYTVKYKW